ncbi:MAG: putative Ig domain-containing protein, partial [Acidobacteriota bacterium]|nr:putative Ig domain-containing protein [Acidobacteriota bacterium]
EATVPYSISFAASGGVAPYTWSQVSGTLPPGLSLAPNGSLAGTPSTPGNYTFSIQAADSGAGPNQQTATAAFALTINPAVTITTTSPLSSGVAGIPYSFTFTGSGGTAPYTWSTPGAPAGFALSAGGLLSGTPGTPGTFTITVKVADSAGATAQQTFTFTVASRFTITTASPLPGGEVGLAYSSTLAAAGGAAPYTWSQASGALPPGLSLAPNGAIAGTPTTVGTYTFAVQAVDSGAGSNQQSATANFAITINPSLGITSASPLPSGVVGTSYSFSFAGTGGFTPYAWSATGIPAGLNLNGSGALAGVPSSAGSFTLAVQIADAAGATLQQNFALTINPKLTLTTASPLATGEAGIPYSATLAASGGVAPYTWSSPSSSALPPGLSLAANGNITGTAGAAGTFSFAVQVTDSGSGSGQQSATVTLSLTIAPKLAISSSSGLPGGSPSSSYSFVLTATGGVPPLTWSIASGTLPSGLTLNPSTGAITGFPAGGGSSTFTVQVTDALKATSSQVFSLSVNSGLAITTAGTLPPGTVGAGYAQTLSASGGVPPILWSLPAGSTLPSGLTLNANGLLSGTPTAAGTFSFAVQAVDSSGAQQSATQTFQLTINGAFSITTASPLPGGSVGAAYSVTFSSSGGKSPIDWSVAGAGLPAGLNLSSSGILSGNPAAAGTFNFTIQSLDSAGLITTKPFTVTFGTGLTITSTSPLPTGSFGLAYSFPFAATGGVLPYTWSIASGSLPPGLALNGGTGLLSGTPSASGTFTFTIQVADSTRNIASQTVSLRVNSGLTITTASPLPSGTVNDPYTGVLAALGGTAPLAW